MDRTVLGRVSYTNQRVTVDPYELEEFKKLLNHDICQFTILNEMMGCGSLEYARSGLFMEAGRCQITLKLANEYIKTAQKATIEILGRVRNQLLDPAQQCKQGLNDGKMASLLQIKHALEQGKLAALALVQAKKTSKLRKKNDESGLAGILAQKDEAGLNARRN